MAFFSIMMNCQPCLPNFQCFQSCLSWTPFCIFSFCYTQTCRSLRNICLGGRILGLIKSDYYGWLSMMTSSEGPLFGPASGLPNPKPTTAPTPQPGLLLWLARNMCCNS